MKVLKFGGTSVANAENIKLVLSIVTKNPKEYPVVVVVSAFTKVTDMLILAAKRAAIKDEDYKDVVFEIEKIHLETLKKLIPIEAQSGLLSHIKRIINHLETLLDGCFLLGELSERTLDTIVSFGELLSSYIIAQAFKQIEKESTYKDSRDIIKTNADFGKAMVNFELTSNLIQNYFAQNPNRITIIPGFIASTEAEITTTLGRGGSDYTAAILAGALNASILEIWTDVSGMYTANPKIVKQAQPITSILYQEAMELSHFGAKVLYPPTIQPVLQKNIPIVIKNTFDSSAKGTLISDQPIKSNNPIKGISHIENITLITLEGSGMIGVSGSSKRLFEVLSQQKINVIFITQASSEHSICIGILNSDAEIAEIAINNAFSIEMKQGKIEPCILEKNLCIIAIVGENMKNHQGLSGKMFSALGKNNVNIRAIAQGASERNISAVIQERDVKKALNTLHEAFFEENTKQLNLFVMGVGNVGEKFIEQIQQQKKFLKENLKINIRVIAISNSKKMRFNPDGISLKNWQELLLEGENTNQEQFIANVKKMNLRNSIFVDITASQEVSELYEQYLSQNIAIVTCNKIACSSSFEHYKRLKNLARKYNAPFLFETNVGAGLPIIDTLKNLIASGDKVHKIQAVLSGSLNFIFNTFDEKNSFCDAVEKAVLQGFTEPDPKIDLSGIDVARKILILIRESGYEIEIDEIAINSFVPEECFQTTNNNAFFESLTANSSHFEQLLKQSKEKDCQLKYVATFENGNATVGLEFIDKKSPFYNLEGKDNIVLFYTDRYQDQPLLIKGAGAGAAVTASGIFADVIRIGNR